MKIHQKWDLLVLNSKDFVNFIMSNLWNFQKFYRLKNFKNLTFSIFIFFFIISTASHVSNTLIWFSFPRCIYWIYFETFFTVLSFSKFYKFNITKPLLFSINKSHFWRAFIWYKTHYILLPGIILFPIL